MAGEIKRFKIKDKSGNEKIVEYNPNCGLTSQEFIASEIAKFNAEKESAAKKDAESAKIDEKKVESVSKPEVAKKPETSKASSSAKVEEKQERSVASILAGKSGVKLSGLATKRSMEEQKRGKKPKSISRGDYITKGKLVEANAADGKKAKK